MTKNTFLWRIAPPGDIAPSYLFGTMHVRDERAFGWLDLAQKHLAECAVFATEFDFSEMDTAAMEATLRLPDGVQLPDLLPKTVWKSLERLCKKQLRMPAEAFRDQHPMAVSTAVTQAFLADDMPYSLDETLWQIAQASGKTCTGVETFAEQMDIVRRIPLKTHAQNLASLLKKPTRYRRHIRKMTEWYQRGDVTQIARAAKRDAKGLRRILIYERNELMARRFAGIAAAQPLFCAVGAGHLSGQKGVLRLLKKAGFVVRPVML